MQPSRKKFKEGDRVRANWSDPYSGVPKGAKGTCALIATVGGKSVYPDPSKLLVFVNWDEHGEKSVPRSILDRIKSE